MNWFGKSNRPEWIQRYLSESWKLKKAPLSELQFAVVDIETTGFDRHKDRILSVAVSLVKGEQCRIADSKEWVVYREHSPLNEAVKVHGIMPSISQQGVPEKQVMEELFTMIGGSIVVGHHIMFDAIMLNESLFHYHHVSFRNRLIDTAQLSMCEIDAFKKTGYSNQKPPTLDEVCNHLGIPLVARHTAHGDVFVTTQLFLFLLGRVKQRLGDQITFKDLKVKKF